MGIWKIIGLYFLISGLIITYSILEAPTVDGDGNVISESKLNKFKKLWKRKKK
jgi:hypothetical protein